MVVDYSQRTKSFLSNTNNHISMILDVESDQFCLACGVQRRWSLAGGEGKIWAIALKFRATRFWQKKNRTHGINGLCFEMRV